LKLSVVCPSYNEQDNVKPLVEEIEKALKDIDHEIIIVDVSNDKTEENVKKIMKKNKNVILEHDLQYKGLSRQVIRGFEIAKGEVIAVMDSDLQHPPHLLKKMYEEIVNGADFVIPSRFIKGGSDGGLNLYRKFVSFVARELGKVYLPSLRKISDLSSGYFMFKKENLNDIYELDPIGWKIMLEVLMKSKYEKIVEIPHKFDTRNSGVSKMSKKVIMEYLEQLKRLRKCKNKNKYVLERKYY